MQISLRSFAPFAGGLKELEYELEGEGKTATGT